jgi:3,4-dihydroxyphthalate decarboxylase
MTVDLVKLRALLASACRVLAARELSEGILGHVSARVGADELMIRCRGPQERGLAWTSPADIHQLALDADSGSASARTGPWTAPNELPIHTEVLRQRPDVQAVVHAHCESVVAADLAGLRLRPIVGSYDIPAAYVLRYGLPVYERSVLIRSQRLAAEMVAALADWPAVILRGHGLVTTGATVQEAVLRAIAIDKVARISLTIVMAGGTLADIPDRDFAELPDLGAAFNIDTSWRHELARLPRQDGVENA